MEFKSVMDVVEQTIREAHSGEEIPPPSEDDEAHLEERKEALAWLHANRALIEAAPRLADCEEQLQLANKRITTLTGMPFSDRMHAALQSRVKIAEAETVSLKAERDYARQKLHEASVLANDNRLLACSASAERDALLEALVKLRDANHMVTSAGRLIASAAIANCKEPKAVVEPEPQRYIRWRNKVTGEEGQGVARWPQSRAQSACEELNRICPTRNHWPVPLERGSCE